MHFEYEDLFQCLSKSPFLSAAKVNISSFFLTYFKLTFYAAFQIFCG